MTSSDKTGALSAVEAENLDKNGDKEQMIRYPHNVLSSFGFL